MYRLRTSQYIPSACGDLPDQLGVAGVQPGLDGGAKVADVGRQHGDRAFLGFAGPQDGIHPVREPPEVVGVAGPQPRRLGGQGQPLDGEAADGLEHPEPRLGRIVAALQQALVQQAVQRTGGRLAYPFGGLQRAASGEGGQPPEQGLLGLGEQVMAPFDGGAQCPVPGLGVARPGEQVEPGIDPVQQLRRGVDAQPRGRQLQRQRQPVQPRAEPVHNRRRFDQDARGCGAFTQQRDRIAGGQRRHREDAFGRQLQPLAAGGEHHQLVTRR